MQVGEQPEAIAPGVRGELPVPQVCRLCNLPRTIHPHREGDIRLVDVERVCLDEPHHLWHGPHHLASGNLNSCLFPYSSGTDHIRLRQGFLEPEHTEIPQFVRNAVHSRQRERWRDVTRHPPHLVEIHHEIEVISHSIPRRTHRSDSLCKTFTSDADLHRAKAQFPRGQRRLGACLGNHKLSG